MFRHAWRERALITDTVNISYIRRTLPPRYDLMVRNRDTECGSVEEKITDDACRAYARRHGRFETVKDIVAETRMFASVGTTRRKERKKISWRGECG